MLVLQFIKNAVRDVYLRFSDTSFYIDLNIYHNDGEIVVNNRKIKEDLGIPSTIPGIGVVKCVSPTGHYFHKIVINDNFNVLPEWVKEAFICHEQGHIVNEYKETKLYSSDYYEEELKADMYSYSHGHDMLGALKYLMFSYPSLINLKRICNLKKEMKK